MNRRDFILLANALGLCAWAGEVAFAQSGSVRVRRSITSAASAPHIETLRRGVSSLRSNSVSTQYASWMYWANSHGTPEPVPPAMQAVWNRCHHGTPHFLTWHRAYVFFFESLIREVTGEDAFALPYWDWYSSPAIPPPFASAGSPDDSNSLHDPQRSFAARTLIRDALQRRTFMAFQQSLEGNPHGTVHVMVSGNMGNVSTAGRDPLFWAHHANVDRMWSVWLAADAQRANPADAGWLNEGFAFSVDGNRRLTVREMLATEDLGYDYDSVTAMGPADNVPAPPAAMVVVPALAPAAPDGASMTLSSSSGLQLTGESLAIELRVPENTSARLLAMSKQPPERAGHLKVIMDGVRATTAGQERGFEYRIYVNLPQESSSQGQHADFYLGVLNSFLLGHHAQHGVTLEFDVAPLAAAQAEGGLWRTSAVTLSLLSDDASETRPLLEIGRISLRLEEPPAK